MDGSPPSGDARIEPIADARTARAALAAAGASPDLDAALQRAVTIVRGRFAADHACYFVHYGEHRPHVAADGNLALDEAWLMRWVALPDREYRAGVASDSSPLIPDLSAIARSPSQEEAYQLGARSGMRLPLLDERGEMLGFVSLASRSLDGFDASQLEEFRELAALSASFIRRALLLEQMELERDLLAQEAALLAGLASTENANQAMQLVADHTREALRASIVVILARPLETDAIEPIVSAASASVATQWGGLREAMRQPGNVSLLNPDAGNCYINHDLRVSAPTPVERWLRDSLGQVGVLIASGRVAERRRFAIAATRADGERWEGSVIAFLSRITSLLEITIERQRTRGLALQQSARLASQARLLTALDPTKPVREIAATFAEEIKKRHDVECLAILRWARPDSEEPMLYRSPRLLPIPAGHSIPSPDDYSVSRSGEVEYLQFVEGEEPAGDVERLLYRSGIRRVARIPLAVQNATSGFVSVTWDDEPDLDERLTELQHAVRPLALVIERASLLADIEHQRQTLEVAAGILASLATATEMEEAGGLIAERLRNFFDADHVVAATLDFAAGTRQVIGLSSLVVTRSELPVRMGPGDDDAYRESIDDAFQVLPDLQELDLNPGTEIARRAGLRSLIRASFALSGGEVGLVSVASRQPNKYRRDDAIQLLEFCRPVGLAIDRMQLMADMAATTEVLAAQTRVLASLGPGATTESAGEVLVAEARRLFGATHAAITMTAAGNAKVIALSSEQLTAEDLRFENPTHESVRTAYRSLLAGKAQLIPNLALARTGEVEERAYAAGLRTLMRAPIVSSAGRVSGAIVLGSPTAYAWGERELSVLFELSSALGLVAARAELFEAAEERSAKASALTRLLSTFNVNAPPDEVARLFAGEVRRFLGADSVLVMSFDHETDTRTVVANDTSLEGPSIRERNSLARSTSYRGMLESPTGIYNEARGDSPPWLRETATALGLGSVIAVRLDAESVPVGLIAAGALVPGQLGEGELTILSEVAAPLAMLLERARVLTSLQQQTQRTQAVLDILAALGPRDTISEVAQPVAEALRSMYQVEHCAVNALDEGHLVLAGIDSQLAAWTPGSVVVPTELFNRVVHDGFQLDDTETGTEPPGSVDEFLRSRGMRSALRVLIGRREEPLGFVTVGSTAARRFTEADARELAQIVQPLGVVVSYFRDKRQAEQRTLKLEYTNRILTRLSAGGTAEHLATGFLAECRVLFGCAHGVAMYFNPEEGMATLLSADSTVIDADAMPRTVPIHSVHAGRLLGQPIPHFLDDVRNHPIPGESHVGLVNAGLLSSIQAPLIVQDKVKGAISLWAEGASRFTSEDADLLGTLTRPLALALEKASALESLGESELKYRSLVAQAEEMIFQFDSETRAILDANAHTGRSLGYSQKELLGLRLDDILDLTADDIASHIAATMQDGELHLVDRHFLRQDGTQIDVDLVASLVSYGRRRAVLVLARDVSERKAFQRQLVQGQKMEALGNMAGHVAHDFNNLLTTILGFAGLLKRSHNMDAEERENLGLIEDAARRAADLTGHLLQFARGGLVRFGPIDLRTVLNDTMQLAKPSLHAALHTTVSLPETPVMVEGDSGQLHHAIFNIVANARDAMPEGGSIDIALRSDGMTATVSIADNGPGMDDETRTRIFEPFYTTKPLGTGNGLGMAITFGIIQGHHGDISVDSKKGRGTTFVITLPLLPGGSSTAAIDAFNAGEGNLVLVVDDDEMVRRTTSATLASLGYNVVEAPGGATAVEIVRARPERFSVVLLDLVMPGMTGSETFRALTAIRPDLPVVVCTGYAADAHIDMDVKRRIAGLVQKPFTGERLQRALLAAGALPTRVVSSQ